MSKKTKVAGNPQFDATLPHVSITVKGNTYYLCFDYASLAVAERKLGEAGITVNLLAALDFRSLGAERLPIVLYAALLKAHPSITYEDASALVTMKTFGVIFEAVVDAYVKSMAEPSAEAEEKPADPAQEPVG